MARCRFAVIVLTSLLFLLPVLARAQATPSVTGRVVDPSGGAVAAAAVRVTGADGAATRVTTEPEGTFAVSGLKPGTYRIAGFSIAEFITFSPGVTVQQANGPRDVLISVRGSNSQSTFGLRNIQVFEDGLNVTQPDGLARTDLVDPHACGSIDVARGPSSLLCGNDAVPPGTGGAR